MPARTHDPSVAAPSPARPTDVSGGHVRCTPGAEIGDGLASPQRIRRSPRFEAVEGPREGVEFVREQVRVGVERHGRCPVSELLLHDFHPGSRRDLQGRRVCRKLWTPSVGGTRPISSAGVLKVRRFQFVTRRGPPSRSGNARPVRGRYSPSLIARNPGRVTDRAACVFGVPGESSVKVLGLLPTEVMPPP
jgi:hypothetical protein